VGIALFAFVVIFLLITSAGILVFFRAGMSQRLAAAVAPFSERESWLSWLKPDRAGDSFKAVIQPFDRVLPKSPQEVSVAQKRLMGAGFREDGHLLILYGAKAALPLVLCVLVAISGVTNPAAKPIGGAAMGTLNLIERDSVLRPLTRQGFWQCQFGSQVTTPQIIFDIAFGIVGPILCFALDPVVFRGGIGGGPLFPDIKIYVYLFSGLEVVMLSFWLLARAGLQLWNDLSGAALLVGGVFCLAVGLILLPFSLMGLMVGVGIFGFTPFVTGIVYLRNGIRALRSPRSDNSAFSRVVTILLSSLVAIGAPLLLGVAIHQAVESSIDEIVHGDALRNGTPRPQLTLNATRTGAVMAFALSSTRRCARPAAREPRSHS